MYPARYTHAFYLYVEPSMMIYLIRLSLTCAIRVRIYTRAHFYCFAMAYRIAVHNVDLLLRIQGCRICRLVAVARDRGCAVRPYSEARAGQRGRPGHSAYVDGESNHQAALIENSLWALGGVALYRGSQQRTRHRHCRAQPAREWASRERRVPPGRARWRDWGRCHLVCACCRAPRGATVVETFAKQRESAAARLQWPRLARLCLARHPPCRAAHRPRVTVRALTRLPWSASRASKR